MGATDNLVRDLVNFGHVEALRRNRRLRRLFEDEKSAISIAQNFWRSHEIVRKLVAEFGLGIPFSEQDFARVSNLTHSRSKFSLNTLAIYSNRALRWLLSMGIMQRVDMGNLIIHEISTVSPATLLEVSKISRSDIDRFTAPAPPNSVVNALSMVRKAAITKSRLEASCGRNSVAALFSLRLVTMRDGLVVEGQETANDASTAVRIAASKANTIQLAIAALLEKPDSSGNEVGARIAAATGIRWSSASQTRNGTALAQWAKWISSGIERQHSMKFVAP